MTDPTEQLRRERIIEINAAPGSREALEAVHGQVWDTNQLSEDFEVIGFLAPVVVRRRSDGVKGSLEFQAQPSPLLRMARTQEMTDPLDRIDQGCYLALRFMMQPSATFHRLWWKSSTAGYVFRKDATTYHPLEAVLRRGGMQGLTTGLPT